MNIDKKTVYSAAVTSFLFSYLVHHPILRHHIYSDIVAFWNRGFLPFLQVPYLEAEFEYPPLAGFIAYVSAFGRNITAYYTIFSLIIFASYLVLLELVMRIASEKGVGLEYVLVFLVLSPSIVLYSVYNFDMIFAALLIASLYLFSRGNLRASATVFSVAALIKLVNLIFLPFILMEIRSWRERIRYAVIAVGIFAVVNLSLWALNPKFIDETYLYHARWGLEDAWFIAFFPDRSSWDTAKLFSMLLMGYGLLKVYLCDFEDVYQRMFMGVAVFLLTTYVFTPQMLLWILPFLAIFGKIPIPYFGLELANSAILLTWFETSNPTKFGSLPQNFAILRAILLFMILLESYFWFRRSIQVVPSSQSA
ncbi:MAG: DUF2029 domain-containing protein [Thaumarchaeota archaeon]|nr:DUF2029 domain-containing protein [Nitrososphaerota archaeon]